MNLHVFSDTYGLFPSKACERIAGINDENNRCVTLAPKSQLTHPKMEYIQKSIPSFKKYINSIDKIEKIVVHPIDYISSIFLILSKKKFPNAKVYWICWSYDVYNLHLDNDTFLEPYSLAFKNKSKTINEKLVPTARRILDTLRVPFRSKYYLRKAYELVDYFGSFLEQDYFNMKEIINADHIQYIPFSYLSIEDLLPNINKQFNAGNGIIIGHAGSRESNQYELLEKISKLKQNKKIILPLAYGDPKYIREIASFAQSLNFKNIEIILTKIPMEQYYENLENASHAIFNLKIQQALGNILGLLYMGKKVFLREETSTYQEFVKLGLEIYSTNSDINDIEINEMLSEKQIINNQLILMNKYSDSKVNNYWSCILN